MTPDVLEIIPANRVAAECEVWDFQNPCMPGFIESMILHGHYLVTDENGKTLSPKEALELIENDKKRKE